MLSGQASHLQSRLLLRNAPFSSRYATIFFASALLIPDTYSRSGQMQYLSLPLPYLHNPQLHPPAPHLTVSGSYHADTGQRRWIWGRSLLILLTDPEDVFAMEAALHRPTSKFGNSSVASLPCGIHRRTCLINNDILDMLWNLF